MSKEYNEPWDTAFLAGAVDVLSQRLDGIMDYPNNIAVDIFYVRDNNLSLLNDSVKERLKYYYRGNNGFFGDGDDEDWEKEIDALDFQLTEVEKDAHSFICETLGHYYCTSDKLSDEVKFFLEYMRRYLKEPLCIYQPASMPWKPGFVDINSEILGHAYLYVGFEYFFISYKDHFVLFILGSVE